MTCQDDPSAANELGESVTPSPQGPVAKSNGLPGAAPASLAGGAAPEAHEALVVLAQAVQKLLERNKQPRAAGVKSEMQRIIGGSFDQTAYGYGTFREFIDDAESNGVVVVVNPPNKVGDPLIILPGQEIPTPSPALPRKRGRIRPDVWRAFTSWEPGYTRVWDIEADQVLMFATEPRPLEPPQNQLWRAEAAKNPERFRGISVITEDQLVERMNSFVESLDPTSETGPVLRAALQQDRPARSFTAAARGLPGIAERWKQDRFDFVWTSITEWQQSNGVQFSIQDTVRREAPRTAQRTGPAVQTGQISARLSSEPANAAADATRERILAALSRMPLSELLRLRVPVEYLIDQ